MPRRLTLTFVVTLLLVACGGSEGTREVREPDPPPPSEPVTPPADGPRSATALVQLLAEIAGGTRPGSLENHVDQAFADRLASGDDLAGLFRGWPDGCSIEYDESPGYAQVAIPPPMDDDPPDEVTRIEEIIADLRASTEVEASCEVDVTYQDDPADPPVTRRERQLIFTIATRPGADGIFRAMAWRDFRNEGHGH